MSSHDDAKFSTCLRRVGSTWLWTVVCDRCGIDLSNDFSRHPVTLIKIDGLNEMLAYAPDAVEARIARLRVEWDRAAQSGRPMLMDANDDVISTPSCDLQRVILEHAESCA